MVVMQDHRKCPKALGNNFVFPEKGLEKRDFIGKSGTNETKYLEHLNNIINNICIIFMTKSNRIIGTVRTHSRMLHIGFRDVCN